MPLKKIFIVLIISFFTFVAPKAQTLLDADRKAEVIESLASRPGEWTELSISGKLKMAGLPLSPSLKIYMQKDSSIICSVRAPLLGEVGRMEVGGDSLLLVNKMKKIYVSLDLDELKRFYPGNVSDLQSLLLGRVFIPGYGEIDAMSAVMVDIFDDGEGRFALLPQDVFMPDEFSYGYVLSEECIPELLLVLPEFNPEINIEVGYEYFKNGYNITASYLTPDNMITCVLELDTPKDDGTAISPIKLDKKYRRATLQQFLSSF